MPIISIHEEVALLITEKYKELDTSDFYLGAMAPDSVNLEFFAPKEDRWTTHLRKKDLTDWRINLRKYYDRNKKYYPKEFILGYITHVLTDIIYDDLYYDSIKELEDADNIPSELSHQVQGTDMEHYSSISKYKDKIKQKLKEIDKFYGILIITPKTMELFRDKELNRNYEVIEPTYINEQLLIDIANSVIEELKDYM